MDNKEVEMRKLMVGCLLMSVALIVGGCCSSNFTKAHTREAALHAVQLQAVNGQPAVMVNVGAIGSWWSAVSDDPVGGITAFVEDGAMFAAAAYGYEKIKDHYSSSSSSSSSAVATPSTQTAGANNVYNIGNGTVTITDRHDSTSGSGQ